MGISLTTNFIIQSPQPDTLCLLKMRRKPKLHSDTTPQKNSRPPTNLVVKVPDLQATTTKFKAGLKGTTGANVIPVVEGSEVQSSNIGSIRDSLEKSDNAHTSWRILKLPVHLNTRVLKGDDQGTIAGGRQHVWCSSDWSEQRKENKI